MAIHWQVKFKSLRQGEVYTVNIYDSTFSGTPVQLIGAAEPFVTQEDDDDDMFTPVRTQSGYIRIVDDGSVNWRDIIPTTDVDRPVTLTDSNGNVKWQGFMQAQNFGAQLYESPQERDFPVQCSLSVVGREDIPTSNTQIHNFAYILKTIVDSIPSTCRPENFVIQGGADAREWLMKQIDWSNYVQEETEYGVSTIESKYDLMTALQDMCNYWGWCARVYGQTMYLTCIDDTTETDALLLTYAELGNLASGSSTSAGSVETMVSDLTIGDIFAGTNNDDSQLRGPSEAVVKAESNPFDANILKFTGKVSQMEIAQGWQSPITEGDKSVRYTNNLSSFSVFGMSGSSYSGNATFNAAEYSDTNQSQEGIITKGYDSYDNLIMVKTPYNGTVFASLETEYEHCFSHNFLELNGTIYQKTAEYKDVQDLVWYGKSTMYIQLGIGRTRATARWLTNTVDAWGNSPTPIKVTIGNKGKVFYIKQSASVGTVYTQYLYINEKLAGKLFVDFLGSDDIKEHAGSRNFEIRDFTTTMYHNGMMQILLGRWDDAATDTSLQTAEATRDYRAKSSSMVKDKMNVDNVYATDNDMRLGSGIVIDSDNGYFKGFTYPGSASAQTPEQHYANRIVNYWATSKRKIECELLSHNGTAATVANAMSPRNTATIAGTTMYPISISREWRDDVVKLVLMEAPRLPDGYTELFYLESTGTQYIELGLKLNCSTDDTEVCFSIPEGVTNKIFGVRTSMTSRAYALEVNSGKWRLGWGGVTMKFTDASPGIHVAYIDHDGGTLKIDGIEVGSVGNASTTTQFGGLLFALRASDYYYHGRLQVFSFKIRRSGFLIMNLIPAMRDSDCVVGMYDLISNTFLTNDGEGAFDYGTL